LHTGAFATPICRSQIYRLFFRQFQKQNLHSAFEKRSTHRGLFPIRVIIGTAPTCYDRTGNAFPRWEVMRDFYY
jgi:hypothetical protein